MRLLENRFRRQFHSDGAGYVFVRRGHEVRFTADEAEGFVAEWRRLWLNPLLWGGWLLIGVGGPYWLAQRNFAPGAWTLGLVAAGLVAMVLLQALLRPREAAEARLPDEPSAVAQTENPWHALTLTIVWGLAFFTALWWWFERGFDSLSSINFTILWGGMFLGQLLRWLRLVAPESMQAWRWLETLAFLTPAVGIVVATALHPAPENGDLILAGTCAAGLAIVVVTLIWVKLRGPRAEADSAA